MSLAPPCGVNTRAYGFSVEAIVLGPSPASQLAYAGVVVQCAGCVCFKRFIRVTCDDPRGENAQLREMRVNKARPSEDKEKRGYIVRFLVIKVEGDR